MDVNSYLLIKGCVFVSMLWLALVANISRRMDTSFDTIEAAHKIAQLDSLNVKLGESICSLKYNLSQNK